MRWLWLGMLVACGLGADADLDGFGSDDCNDEDPTIYPGAPDLAGDGIDADCDGLDPQFAFLGGWTLSAIDASYFSLDAIEPELTTGTLMIEDDLSVLLDVNLEIREELIGFPLNAPLELVGVVSAIPGPDRFAMVLEGDLFGEFVTTDFICEVDEGNTYCRGGLKALDITFDVSTEFTPE